MNVLRIFAVLFAVMAVSNFAKPLELVTSHGFVLFGRRLTGVPNTIAATSFGLFLAAYAWSLWRGRAEALAMGIAYAVYVSGNMALFTLRSPELVATSMLFGITYVAVAATASWGAVAAASRAGLARDALPHATTLRVFALLFGLMAVSNLLKPFAYTDTVGFVFLGQRLAGLANALAAPAFAVFLGVYAYGIWQERRWALGMGIAYAGYVIANLVLWNFRKPEGTETSLLFGILYLLVAVGVSGGSAWLLSRVRDRLV